MAGKDPYDLKRFLDKQTARRPLILPAISGSLSLPTQGQKKPISRMGISSEIGKLS